VWVESDAECTKNPQQMQQRGQGEDTEEGFVASVGGRQWYVLLACVHVARDLVSASCVAYAYFIRLHRRAHACFFLDFRQIRSDPSGMCGGVGYFRRAVIRVGPKLQRARS